MNCIILYIALLVYRVYVFMSARALKIMTGSCVFVGQLFWVELFDSNSYEFLSVEFRGSANCLQRELQNIKFCCNGKCWS
jgi:hypothetical protein